MPILFSYVSGLQKSYLFSRSRFRNAKNRISKNYVNTFLLFFFTIAQQKIKILFYICQACCLYVGLQHILRFYSSKILDFIGICLLKNRNFEFGESKQKYYKYKIAIFLIAQFYIFWCFWIAFHSKPVHSRSLQTFAAF